MLIWSIPNETGGNPQNHTRSIVYKPPGLAPTPIGWPLALKRAAVCTIFADPGKSSAKPRACPQRSGRFSALRTETKSPDTSVT